jgi:hypothetical protein
MLRNPPERCGSGGRCAPSPPAAARSPHVAPGDALHLAAGLCETQLGAAADARLAAENRHKLRAARLIHAVAHRWAKAVHVTQHIDQRFAVIAATGQQQIVAQQLQPAALLDLLDTLEEQVAPAVALRPLTAGADRHVVGKFAVAPHPRQRRLQLLHQPGHQMCAGAQLRRRRNLAVHKAAGKAMPTHSRSGARHGSWRSPGGWSARSRRLRAPRNGSRCPARGPCRAPGPRRCAVRRCAPAGRRGGAAV